MSEHHPYPRIGQRIRLRANVPRFDAFLAQAGMTGTVVAVDPDPRYDFISARMDQPLSENEKQQRHIEEEWDNCIHWVLQMYGNGDEISALNDFLQDCEYIE